MQDIYVSFDLGNHEPTITNYTFTTRDQIGNDYQPGKSMYIPKELL